MRGVRPVPPALPDLPDHGRGGRVASWTDRGDARGDGRCADLDDSFAAFMDRCLVCRACEDVCPSHVPFGRMMEAAREQVEPTRARRTRFLHWLGFHWVLPHPTVIRAATLLQPVVRPFLPRRVRAMIPTRSSPFATLPSVTDPPAGVARRGSVALLAGCVQDRWFHQVNLATIRVLARAGWRVTVPKGQACCGALAAHNGRLGVARRLAGRAHHAFADADVVVVNASGCSAHMQTYEELRPGTALPVLDLMAFLGEQGLGDVELRAAAAHRRLPRRLSRPACPAHPRRAAGAARLDPRSHRRRDRARRPVLRRRRDLRGDPACAGDGARSRQGGRDRGDRRDGRRVGQPRMHRPARAPSGDARHRRGAPGGAARPGDAAVAQTRARPGSARSGWHAA